MGEYQRSREDVKNEIITIIGITLVGILLFGAAEFVKAEDTFLDNETILIDQDDPDQDPYYDEADPVDDEVNDFEDEEDDQQQDNG